MAHSMGRVRVRVRGCGRGLWSCAKFADLVGMQADRAEDRTRMAKVVQIAKNLSILQILTLLNSSPKEDVSTLPPVKPRGGEVYLYEAQENPDIKKGNLILT